MFTNQLYCEKKIVKNINLKAITGNFSKSWQSFVCTCFWYIWLHFSQAILYSSFELVDIFGFPVVAVHGSFQICPKILNWAYLWRCCRIVFFWHKFDVFVPEVILYWICIMWWSKIRPEYRLGMLMMFSNEWHQYFLDTLLQVDFLVDRHFWRHKIGIGGSHRRYCDPDHYFFFIFYFFWILHVVSCQIYIGCVKYVVPS